MGLVKKLGLLLGTAVLGTQLVCAEPKQSSPFLYSSLGAGLDVHSSDYTIREVPLSLRDVPVHPDYLLPIPSENIAPIKDKRITFSNLGPSPVVSGRFGVGIDTGRLSFIVGGEFKRNFLSLESSRVERNYTTFPGTDLRGVGAELTYYRVMLESPELSFGSFAKISYKPFDDNKLISLFFDYSLIHGETFYVENGWDRDSSLEVKSKTEFATVLSHTLKFGVNLHTNVAGNSNFLTPFEFSIGMTFPQIIPEAPFKKAHIQGFPSFVLANKFGI